MREKAERELIRRAILEMERPFYLSTLFSELKQRYDISNRELVVEELNSLLDSGLVRRSDMIDDIDLYQSAFASEPCA